MVRARQHCSVTLSILAALALASCGGASGGDAAQADGSAVVEDAAAAPDEGDAEPAAEDAEAAEPRALAGYLVGQEALVSSVGDIVALEPRDTLSEVARDLIAGDVDMAVVGPADASALYFACGGEVMAIDATADEEGGCVAVTVVSAPFLQRDPESALSYITAHEEAVAGSGFSVLRGSALQDSLSAVIADVYVESPQLVGGDVPPDNFYFLG